MSRQIDDALADLSTNAPHPGLEGLESRVLHAVSIAPLRTIGVGGTLTAAAVALALGLVSNLVPTADAQAAPVLSPFGASNPLAPSTLLTATR